MLFRSLYFEVTLPNGKSGQQLLDIVDYISNSFLMPLIAFLTAIFVGWVIKPKWIKEEMIASGHAFTRKKLYNFMIRFVAPAIMAVLFFQSTGLIH